MNKKKEVKELLKRQGYTVEIDRWPKKSTYYKPSGEALPNLPSDPFSMEKYLRRGFTLEPPQNPVLVSDDVAGGNGDLPVQLIKCSYPRCRYMGTARGLKIHQRKHGRERQKTVLGTE